jgi:kynurenine formamidase
MEDRKRTSMPERADINSSEGRNQRLAALQSVSDGALYELGTELATGMPTGPSDTFAAFRITPYRTPQCLSHPESAPAFDFSMDLIQGSPHVGSHIDAFAHVQSSGKVYGGRRAADVYSDFGWTENGIETVSPIVSRGLLLDVPALLNVARLPDLFEVTTEHIGGCLERQQVQLKPGDAVLVRTGKIDDYHGDGSAYFRSAPGVGVDAALWLHERGMSVLGSDTSATEPVPFPDPENTVHKAMLVERGIHLIEILDLDRIAAAQVYEFLFLCCPLMMRGATGSWVRPVAIT